MAVAAGATGTVSVFCAPGDVATGGGYFLGGNDVSGAFVKENVPGSNEREWGVTVINHGSEPLALTGYAVCVAGS